MFRLTARRCAFGAAFGFGIYGSVLLGRGYREYRRREEWMGAEEARRKTNSNQKVKNRAEQLIALKKPKEFDLLIIGGGATGTGIALDAASRGISVALVEKEDFAAATSGRSTKLVHGGVRYLEKAFWNLDYGQYELVQEALHERHTYLSVAPHLTKLIPIMIPLNKWWQIPYYWAGVKAYDFIAGLQNVPSSYFLSKRKALEAFPVLKADELKGAIVYYDGQTNDSRMNVLLACTAAKQGAAILNHVEVTSLYKKQDSGKVKGAYVRDTLTGEEWLIRAKGVINATGPFADVIRKMDDPNVANMIVPSGGVHIVLPDYYSPRTMGLLDPATSDGRVIFFLPWGNSTIAGTTDSPIELTDRPKPMEGEIHWILNEIKNYLSPDVNVQRGDVLAAWSGIRPLVKDPAKKDTQSLSRSHVIHVSDSGLLTIAGGKWTTYRRMAQDAVDKAIETYHLNPPYPNCRTESIPILGAMGYCENHYIRLTQEFGLERAVSEHLSTSYGDRAAEVARLAAPSGRQWPVLGIRLTESLPYIDGEVRYACQQEYAATVIDVIAQRTRLAFLNARDTSFAIPMIADIMQQELGWDDKRKKEEMQKALDFLDIMGLEVSKVSSCKFDALELIKYREAFSKIDENHDGVITIDELKEAFGAMAVKVDHKSLHDLFNKVAQKGGSLKFGDFVELIAKAKENRDEKELLNSVSDLVDHFGQGVAVERSGGGI